MTSEVLHAYNFENSKVSTLKKINELPSNGFNWIHLDATHTNIAETLLAKNLSINLIAQKALLEEETRPRMVKFDEGILLILRGVNLNDNADPEDMISLRLWVSDNNIITLRKRKLKAVQDIVKNIEGNNLPNSIGDILCQLVERLAERMQPTIARLNELIDDLEETIIDGEDKEIRESILSIRRKSIVLRRYMKPQADAIEELLSSNLSWLSANHSFWLNQSANNIQRYIEDLEVVRDRSHAVMYEITNKIS
jgi:zinc transporter